MVTKMLGVPVWLPGNSQGGCPADGGMQMAQKVQETSIFTGAKCFSTLSVRETVSSTYDGCACSMAGAAGWEMRL